jgi:quercetin dioxygenase-like cupin family protein
MEIKRNEATRNRPEGDRVLDASYVFTDIPAFVAQLESEKAWDKNDRNSITVFKSGNITVVISMLKENATIVENVIDGYISIQVIKGKVDVNTPDGDVGATNHQLISLRPHVAHSVTALEDSILLLTTVTNGDPVS